MNGKARTVRERAYRHRSPSSFCLLGPAVVLSPSSSATALSELWLITTCGVSVLGVKTRLSRVVGEVRTFVGWVSFPGDGGFHRSVDAGSSYRGVEVSFASPSSAQVLGS
ncbi:hypothetical protein DY000_02063964 [Brassica cretica]|uniref:Uncharacterized protein n=1 Tax=Brassica cretica TaxID=69181 RepID=A0ABQ7ASS6_BRACR|nr:hypothetical protein DY000_02063964 [Brassica cretica]